MITTASATNGIGLRTPIASSATAPRPAPIRGYRKAYSTLRPVARRHGSSGPIPIKRTITSRSGPLTRLKKGSPMVMICPWAAWVNTG